MRYNSSRVIYNASKLRSLVASCSTSPRSSAWRLKIYILLDIGNVNTFVVVPRIMMFWSWSDWIVTFFALIFRGIVIIKWNDTCCCPVWSLSTITSVESWSLVNIPWALRFCGESPTEVRLLDWESVLAESISFCSLIKLRVLTTTYPNRKLQTIIRRYHLLAYEVMVSGQFHQRIRRRRRCQADVPVSCGSKCFWDWVERHQHITRRWTSARSEYFRKGVIAWISLSAYCSISPINRFHVGYSCWKTVLRGHSRTVWHRTIAWSKRCIGERRSSIEFARGIWFKSAEVYIDSW